MKPNLASKAAKAVLLATALLLLLGHVLRAQGQHPPILSPGSKSPDQSTSMKNVFLPPRG